MFPLKCRFYLNEITGTGKMTKSDKINKRIMQFIIASGMIFFITIAMASGNHSSITNNYTTYVENSTSNSAGVASAIAAAQHQFNYSVLVWQGSVSAGAYDGETAVSIGLGKRFNSTLINGSISNEGGKYGGGLGVSWTF